MNAASALADIRGYAAANRIVIVRHARQRMSERGAQYEDVRHALAGARRCRAAKQGRWKVFGEDRDGRRAGLRGRHRGGRDRGDGVLMPGEAMKRCASCRSGDLREIKEAVEVRVPSSPEPLVVRVTGVAAVKCGGCGEVFLNGPDLGRAELLAGTEAIARGLRDGGTFKFIRKALGLRASELGDLLDVSPETVSRWENGHRAAERSVWNTLADLVSDKLHGKKTTLDRLTAPKARVPKQPVRLRLAGAR